MLYFNLFFSCFLVSLLPVAATLCQSCFPTGGFAQMHIAALTQDHGLCVRKYSCDLKTSRAFDIHEKRVGRLNESL